MSGGNKASGGTTTSSTAPPQQFLDAYSSLLGRASNAANSPLQTYGGTQVAPFNQTQNNAFGIIGNQANAAQNVGGIAQPYINQGVQKFDQATQPLWSNLPQFSAANVNQYMSPYTQDVINATQTQFNQNNAVDQSKLSSDAIHAGAFGGDRTDVARSLLANQQQQAQAPVIANLYNQGYGNALQEFNQQQQQQLSADQANAWLNSQAGFGIANLGGMSQNAQISGINAGLGGANALLGAGGTQQAQTQQELNVPYSNFLAQQAYPFQTTNFLSGIAGLTGGQSGGTSSTTAPAPSATSQLAGYGLTGLGIAGLTGGFGNNGWLYSSGTNAAAGAAADAASGAVSSGMLNGVGTSIWNGVKDLGSYFFGGAGAARGGRIDRPTATNVIPFPVRHRAGGGIVPANDDHYPMAIPRRAAGGIAPGMPQFFPQAPIMDDMGTGQDKGNKFTGNAVDTNWGDFFRHAGQGFGMAFPSPMIVPNIVAGFMGAKNGELGTTKSLGRDLYSAARDYITGGAGGARDYSGVPTSTRSDPRGNSSRAVIDITDLPAFSHEQIAGAQGNDARDFSGVSTETPSDPRGNSSTSPIEVSDLGPPGNGDAATSNGASGGYDYSGGDWGSGNDFGYRHGGIVRRDMGGLLPDNEFSPDYESRRNAEKSVIDWFTRTFGGGGSGPSASGAPAGGSPEPGAAPRNLIDEAIGDPTRTGGMFTSTQPGRPTLYGVGNVPGNQVITNVDDDDGESQSPVKQEYLPPPGMVVPMPPPARPNGLVPVPASGGPGAPARPAGGIAGNMPPTLDWSNRPPPTPPFEHGYTPPAATHRGIDAAKVAPWLGIAAAGLGTLAGRSPNASTNIGAGGLEGLKTYMGAKDRAETTTQREETAAETGKYRKSTLDVEARKLSDAATAAKDRLAMETKHYADQAEHDHARLAIEDRTSRKGYWEPVRPAVNADGTPKVGRDGNPVGVWIDRTTGATKEGPLYDPSSSAKAGSTAALAHELITTGAAKDMGEALTLIHDPAGRGTATVDAARQRLAQAAARADQDWQSDPTATLNKWRDYYGIGAPAKGGAAPSGTPSIATPTTKAEFDRLPSGAPYINPSDGQTYRKK